MPEEKMLKEAFREVFREEIGQFTDKVLLPAIENIFDEKLDPIKQQLKSIELDIQEIKDILAKLEKQESEDVAVSYVEVEKLKKRIGELELKVEKLQQAG